MPSSVAHALLPTLFAGIANALFPFFPPMNRKQWTLLIVTSVFLANSPDLDLIPAALFPSHWFEIHREWGHNVFSLGFLVAFGTFLLLKIIPSGFSWRRALWVSAFLVGSHVVLDAMMSPLSIDGHRPGVPLFFPFTREDYSLPWIVFNCFEAAKPGENPLFAYATNATNWRLHITHELAVIAVWIGSWAVFMSGMDYFWRRWRNSTKSRRWRAKDSAASSSSGSSK